MDKKSIIIAIVCLLIGFILCFSLVTIGAAKHAIELSNKFGGSYNLYYATESTSGEPYLTCLRITKLGDKHYDCYTNSISGINSPIYHIIFSYSSEAIKEINDIGITCWCKQNPNEILCDNLDFNWFDSI